MMRYQLLGRVVWGIVCLGTMTFGDDCMCFLEESRKIRSFLLK
jgi:hypothetical protein